MMIKERWANLGFQRTEMTQEGGVSLGGKRQRFELEALGGQKWGIMRRVVAHRTGVCYQCVGYQR